MRSYPLSTTIAAGKSLSFPVGFVFGPCPDGGGKFSSRRTCPYAPRGVARSIAVLLSGWSAMVMLAPWAQAQSNYATPLYFTTLAGLGGAVGSSDGTGNSARFNQPAGIVVDDGGTVYLADSENDTIRKISLLGVVGTIAGSPGKPGSANGAGNAALFSYPFGMCRDSGGDLYVADYSNSSIRRITTSGAVTTFAGGVSGSVDGNVSDARFRNPIGLAIDAANNIYVADYSNNAIRKITANGIVTTLAGGSLGSADGTGILATFHSPAGVAVDSSGNVYVADRKNHTVRKVTASGVVTTLAGLANNPGSADGAGSSARFTEPMGIAVDPSGNVYVAELSNHTIRKIAPGGVVTTVAGLAGTPGTTDGSGSTARFNGPVGIAIDRAGNLYIADNLSSTIRMSVAAPAFTIQPVSQTVLSGSTATFSAAVGSSNVALTYQWQRNGAIIPGATSPTLNVTNVQTSSLGSYAVVATNVNTSTTSNPATLALLLPPTIAVQPSNQTATIGGSVTFSAGVTSNGAITYQWLKDGGMIAGATSATFTIPTVQSINLGNYTVVATTAAGSITSNAAVLTLGAFSGSRLSNLSIRSNAGTGAQTLIVGFVVGGAGTSGTKPLLIRGAGPALANFSVPGFLVDPSLSVFSGATMIATNDNWNGDPLVNSIGNQLGAFSFGSVTSKDAALYAAALAPGAFTAQITGISGTTGVALAEIYDATLASSFSATTCRLVNVSARTQVGTGADVLITGFTIAGTLPKTLLIRAIGPTLTAFGVGGVLADPRIELYSGSTLIQSNDNWGGTANIVNAAASVGAFALDATSKDAVLLVTLAPGGYTAQVSGVGATTGVALVEIYDVP